LKILRQSQSRLQQYQLKKKIDGGNPTISGNQMLNMTGGSANISAGSNAIVQTPAYTDNKDQELEEGEISPVGVVGDNKISI